MANLSDFEISTKVAINSINEDISNFFQKYGDKEDVKNESLCDFFDRQMRWNEINSAKRILSVFTGKTYVVEKTGLREATYEEILENNRRLEELLKRDSK